jgi:hypothetical protein
MRISVEEVYEGLLRVVLHFVNTAAVGGELNISVV